MMWFDHKALARHLWLRAAGFSFLVLSIVGGLLWFGVSLSNQDRANSNMANQGQLIRDQELPPGPEIRPISEVAEKVINNVLYSAVYLKDRKTSFCYLYIQTITGSGLSEVPCHEVVFPRVPPGGIR